MLIDFEEINIPQLLAPIFKLIMRLVVFVAAKGNTKII